MGNRQLRQRPPGLQLLRRDAMNETYLKQLTARTNAVASELHSLYGQAGAATIPGL